MQSKTSYFNKTIFLKNITHYWPIWTAYLLICLFRLPLSLYLNLTAQYVTDDVEYKYMETLKSSLLTDTVQSALQPFALFLFACITAIAVFSYLYQARSANMIHALPVCRKSLFITNVLSGISFLLIPQFIAFLAGILVCFSLQMTETVYLLHWLLLSGGMAVFAFGLAVFIVMITGNILAVPAFYLIINYLFEGAKMLITSFIQQLSYGIRGVHFSFGDFLSPYYFLSRKFNGYSSLFTDTANHFPAEAYRYIGGYLLAGIALFIVAFVIYQKKHLETAGDFLTVSFLKPFFRWGSTIFLGLGITMFILGFFSFDNRATTPFLFIIILLTFSGIVIFFLAEMLIQKNFRVFSKRAFGECGIAVILLLALVTGIEYNVFGLETMIPKTEDIAFIRYSSNFNINVIDEDFSKVVSLHQNLVDSKQEIENYFKHNDHNGSSTTVDIVYTLKNNKTISRSYWIPVNIAYLENEDSVFYQNADLENRPEYYMGRHFTSAYDSVTFIEGTLGTSPGNTETIDAFHLNQEQCIQFFEAFKKDVYEGNYCIYDSAIYERISDRIYYNNVSLSYQVPDDFETETVSTNVTEETTYSQHWTDITLTTDCVHSIQALTDMGFINENHQLITQKEADILFSEDEYQDKEIYY